MESLTTLDLTSIMDNYNLGYPIAVVSSLVFFLVNRFVLTRLAPVKVKTHAHREWKWRNISNSLIHSLITGVGACICFWMYPEMREDLINEYNHWSHSLVSLSIGYFIYDLIDMGVNDRKPKTYGLLIHHVIVLVCFSLSMTKKVYTGYAIMALLVEVNSVFLHTRQLMIIQQENKSSAIYRVNNSFNLGTFVVFRLLTLGWMTRWLLQHRSDLTALDFYIGSFSLAVIMWMNITLLQRVLNSDFRQCPPKSEEHKKIR